MMLECSKITKNFGGLAVLKAIDFTLRKKEICGLIGPNGSGKTTFFNCISGVFHPDSGTIKFNETDITDKKAHEICHLGISRTYQIPAPFLNLTCLQNVMIAVLYGKKERKISIREAEKEALHHLDFVGLKDKSDMLARNLTTAGMRKLELAKALATNPELILIDECAAGLNPSETSEVIDVIKRLRDDLDMTIVWVEHVMKAIMQTADRVVVLSAGEKIAEGTPQAICNDSRVIEVYLGERLAI
jgi:branched-chain amino acid transport system ATP-binding protein